jgi:ABC-2 type transport system permease protein
VIADLSTPARPATAGPASSALIFAWRSILKVKHVPEQLGDVVMIPVLFTLMFTYLFGGALAASPTHYLQYLLPGTLAMSVVFVTVYSGVTLNQDLATGTFDRFRSLPVWRAAPIVGGLIGDIGRYLIASSLVLGLGLIMGFRAHGGVLGVAAATALAIVFALALSWAWIALALVLRTPNAVLSIGFVILMPLGFLSNVFVDPATMPRWLERLANLNPMSHLASAARALMAGSPVGDNVWQVLAVSAGLVIVLAPLSMRLYQRKT